MRCHVKTMGERRAVLDSQHVELVRTIVRVTPCHPLNIQVLKHLS
jgi:hypothetical protein